MPPARVAKQTILGQVLEGLRTGETIVDLVLEGQRTGQTIVDRLLEEQEEEPTQETLLTLDDREARLDQALEGWVAVQQTQLTATEARMRRVIILATAAAQGAAGNDETLAEAVRIRQLDPIVQQAGEAFTAAFFAAYTALFQEAGQKSMGVVERALDRIVGFNVFQPRPVLFLQGERARILQHFTDTQRLVTQQVMADGLVRGLGPIAQARNLRGSIGLTVRQRSAVENYRRLLEQGSSEALQRELRDRRFDATVRRSATTGEPLSQAQIDRMVDRYSERMVRHRARTIAQTEALRVVNVAQDEAVRQSIVAGLLRSEEIRREWLTNIDGKERPSHHNLNGLVRGLDELFPGANGPLRFPGDPNAPASEIVNCRCGLRIYTVRPLQAAA